MNVAADIVQPMGPKLVSHGLPNIYAFNENAGVCSLTTSAIRRMQNTTHGSVFEHLVVQGKVVGESVGDYREENYRTDF